MALGAQHASPCAPGRRRARIALETQPLPAALPAAVLRIALGLSITQRAARPRRGRRGLRPRPAALYIHHITARQNIWPEPVLQVPKRSGQRPRPAHEQEHAAARSARAQLALRLGGSQRVNA